MQIGHAIKLQTIPFPRYFKMLDFVTINSFITNLVDQTLVMHHEYCLKFIQNQQKMLNVHSDFG